MRHIWCLLPNGEGHTKINFYLLVDQAVFQASEYALTLLGAEIPEATLLVHGESIWLPTGVILMTEPTETPNLVFFALPPPVAYPGIHVAALPVQKGEQILVQLINLSGDDYTIFPRGIVAQLVCFTQGDP
jgi:hypothetical protein